LAPELLFLHIAVFGAALLQVATGTGFGVIAGPIILMALNDESAIQVSLLIVVVLTPSLIKSVDRVSLPRLVLGTAIGLPLGVGIFMVATVVLLKVLAGIAVLSMAFLVTGAVGLSRDKPALRRGRLQDVAVGAVSGAMSAGLAMPGPMVAACMMTRGQSKVTTRATLLTLFVFSYIGAIAVQAATVGVTTSTINLCLALAPATLLSVLIGKISAGHISERLFRWAIMLILIATGASLLLGAAVSLLDLG
jgi:uncharacterized membrane protein YfcA